MLNKKMKILARNSKRKLVFLYCFSARQKKNKKNIFHRKKNLWNCGFFLSLSPISSVFLIKMVVAIRRIVKVYHAIILPAYMRIATLTLYSVASIETDNVDTAFRTFTCSFFEKESDILSFSFLVD